MAPGRSRWTSVGVPVFGTVLLVFAGVFGGLYSEEIKSAFPFVLGEWAGLDFHALTFWFVFALGLGVLTWNQWQRATSRERGQERLDLAVVELESLIRTTPPTGFLVTWRDYYRVAMVAYETAEGEERNDSEIVHRAIRQILGTVSRLAAKSDDDEESRYAANLMLFKSSQSELTTESILFSADVDPAGFLELTRAYSASTDGDSNEEDPFMEDFALVIPKIPKVALEGSDVAKWKVLPGAPMAAVTGEADYLADVGTIGTWCRERGDFTLETIQEVVQYFRDGGHKIGGFISVPLYAGFGMTDPRAEAAVAEEADSPSNEGKHDFDEPVAVLNVHRDTPGLLRNDGRAAAQFSVLIEPFGDLLVKLVGRVS